MSRQDEFDSIDYQWSLNRYVAREGIMKDNETCPNKENHTPSPEGYLQWHQWAQEMSRDHRQCHCPACGKFVIWVKRGAK